ncbi:MAG: type II toxin-antitoxin system VapC family toxin [Burkholderiaceae bacterium]|nr:type II toxin-antitoxin system VapC family toxin [Burkholderiaceae bacterium]MDZ4144480.1 type II toxin-antitoxin system VapC family toxin [Burkholderiales bacterium]
MNVVDSCGWLEYIADGPNASFFEPALLDLPRLVVPSITIYEVCKRVLVQRGQPFADRAVAAMCRGKVTHLDAEGLRLAALASVQYKLAMADAIIWQTAQQHGAQLFTQDVDLKALPGVKYQAKA